MCAGARPACSAHAATDDALRGVVSATKSVVDGVCVCLSLGCRLCSRPDLGPSVGAQARARPARRQGSHDGQRGARTRRTSIRTRTLLRRRRRQRAADARARRVSNRDTASRSSGSSQGAGGVKRSSKELGEDAEAEAAKRAKDETLVVTRDQLAVEMEHQKALAASNLAEKLAEKTVQALKKELKKAGLDDKGTKPQLLKRLQAHLEAGGGGAAEAAAEAEPMAVEEEKPAAAPEEVEMERGRRAG